MAKRKPTRSQIKLAEELVSSFETQRPLVATFRNQIFASLDQSVDLKPLIHSIKTRIKDPTHLKDKLLRKMCEDKEKATVYDISNENLLTEITDLVGIRILHLYTRQIAQIDSILRDIFKEQQYELLQGPFARTWDDESREFFGSIDIDTQESETMYTSVHYVIGSASKTPVTCEVQVRTLAEEVWGEVDHSLN